MIKVQVSGSLPCSLYAVVGLPAAARLGIGAFDSKFFSTAPDVLPWNSPMVNAPPGR